jgi:hypothetical protein
MAGHRLDREKDPYKIRGMQKAHRGGPVGFFELAIELPSAGGRIPLTEVWASANQDPQPFRTSSGRARYQTVADAVKRHSNAVAVPDDHFVSLFAVGL